MWVIRRTGASVMTRPMTRAQARQLVAQQQDEVRLTGRRPARAQAHNEIVRPVAAQLRDADRPSSFLIPSRMRMRRSRRCERSDSFPVQDVLGFGSPPAQLRLRVHNGPWGASRLG